ncbi:phage baseplate assembly protein V [Variovorax sp. J22R24]|uniref:phage baseplate assembly protein V n=1 Tax=Variovorax gracilis TaxID=3053502 RepID=UPI002574A3DF|nr:phage baseplate assembly protein V [Variovorax sp. J22R24]MDM0109627.1 phage baseplate assembly protein V [Variovorax sp. J22R24]
MNQGGAIAAVVREVDASQGRVRVEYVQIEDGLESPWAYVAAALAGKSRGMLFMPEVGDEVLVIHGNNDFDHPYVVGYLWNGEQRSPETEPEMRVIKTPGGHQLRFEDKDGAKKVILKSDGNRSVTLDDQPGLGKIEVKSGSNQVLMDDNPAGTLVKLQAGTGVGVTITMNATPVPSLAISVGGTTTVTIDTSGVSLTTASLANITCTSATVTAAAALTINAPVLTVNGGFASFTGVLQCSTLVTNAVVSPLHTPGIGNLL